MITERLMQVGAFDVQLREGTPKGIRDKVEQFGWLMVTSARIVDSGMDRLTILGASDYTGVIRRRRREGTGIGFSGTGLMALLGDEDGKGPQSPVAGSVGVVADDWSVFMSATADNLFDATKKRTNALYPGTVFGDFVMSVFGIGNPGQGDYRSTRDALNEDVPKYHTTAVEYRVNADGSVDSGEYTGSGFYKTAAFIWRGPEGTEGTMGVFHATELVFEDDVEDWISHSNFIRDEGTDDETSAGTISPTSYKDFGGSNNIVMQVTVKGTYDGQNTSAEQNAHMAAHQLQETVTCSIKSRPNLHQFLRQGDYAYLYDPEIGLVDPANQVTVAGQTLLPAKYRILGIDWPITRGMGVYVGANDWSEVTDVTDWVEWEEGDTTLEIGDRVKNRSLTSVFGRNY